MSSKNEAPKLVIIPVVVETEHHPECPHYEGGGGEKSGPSKAVSNAYRSGWDSVFGQKLPVGEA
jgi:hypothetical protein